MFYARSILALCGVLFPLLSHATLGYTQEELQAFAQLEQQAATLLPPPEIQQTIKAQQDIDPQFIDQAKAQARYWQEQLDPKLLQGAIDIPSPSQNPNAAPTGVMVFVSLTMPESSLKALLKQSEIWGVPLVIRGVLPEGFAATAVKIQSLLQQAQQPPLQSGFAISPEWFETFDIKEVPTFVAVKDGRCLPKQPCNHNDYDIVRGNVSLPNALEQLAKGDNPDVVSRVLRRGKE